MMPATTVRGQNTAGIAIPTLGFVFDSGTASLRPILGIPGAALLGDPLESGTAAIAAAISPRQDYALVTGRNHELRLIRLQNPTAGVEIDLPPDPERIVLSPMGSAAALYYSATGMLYLFTGLPDAVGAEHQIDLSRVDRMSLPIALSDDGQLILLGNAEDSSSVLLLRSDGGQIRLPVSGPVTALAFRGRSDDAVIAMQDGSITLVRGLSHNPTYEILTDAAAGLAQAIAVEFSADGSRVYAVSAEGAILGLGMAERAPVKLSCSCRPSGLYRQNGRAVFRLNSMEEGPVFLLDTGSRPERVLFVPAPKPAMAMVAENTSGSVQ
jgi:hypothetical protein